MPMFLALTRSSGNHGAALAAAARTRGVPATVVVPDTTPACKRTAITAFGARLLLCASSADAREAACAAEQAASGAVLIHPYNNAAIIAGQGTLALELLEQLDRGDVLCGALSSVSGGDARSCAVIVPVSGGGMISGVATVIKALRPSWKVPSPGRCHVA
jgi:threonine dehydratase